jgi:hypothetical protein
MSEDGPFCVILMVQVAADVGQVLLALVLCAFEETVDLLLLPLVLPQQMHGLRQLELQLALAAGPTALRYLRVDRKHWLARRIERLHSRRLLLKVEILRFCHLRLAVLEAL